jgi:hypothetical protein
MSYYVFILCHSLLLLLLLLLLYCIVSAHKPGLNLVPEFHHIEVSVVVVVVVVITVTALIINL